MDTIGAYLDALSQAKLVPQSSDFGGSQDVGSYSPLGALAFEADRNAIEQFISADVVE